MKCVLCNDRPSERIRIRDRRADWQQQCAYRRRLLDHSTDVGIGMQHVAHPKNLVEKPLAALR